MFFKKFPFNFPKNEHGIGDEGEDQYHEEIKAIVDEGLVFPEGMAQLVPTLAKETLTKIFKWEIDRPRTFELLDDPWLIAGNEGEVRK